MTANDFDDFDKDLPDTGGDDGDGDGNEFGRETFSSEKSSFRETWDNNPMLKLGAVVLGIGLIYGAYTIFGGSGEEVANVSKIKAGNISDAKVIPGKESYDKVYSDALKESNDKIAEKAKTTGESAIPIPIATSKSEELDIPEAKASGNEDPLAEWRARVEQKRKVAIQETIPTEPSQRPIAPMVQPVQPVRQAPVIKTDPQAAKALATQMRVILAAQVPPASQRTQITALESEYTQMQDREKEKAGLATGLNPIPGVNAMGTMQNMAGMPANGQIPPGQQKAIVKTIVPAGNIVYAQLTNELNSDVEGPVLAQIMSGPLSGAKAIGQFSTKGEYLVLEFNRVIKDDVVYTVNAIAMDENTTLAAHQSDVDYHYFSRIILPAAAKFVEGYSSAIAERGTEVTVTGGGGAVQETPDASPKEALYEGLEEAGSVASEVLDQDSNRPITVKVHKGTTMGILFMDSVTTESAAK